MSLSVVVGPGRVGQTLALMQARGSGRVVLAGRKSGTWANWARRKRIEPLIGNASIEEECALVLFAVPDDVLDKVAAEWATRLTPSARALAVHVSGLSGLAPLKPLAERGFRVAAVHPIVPFGEPADGPRLLEDAWARIEAGSGASRVARELVLSWQARPLVADEGDRARYHAALSLAANHITALSAWSAQILTDELGPRGAEVAHDLAEAALEATRAGGGAAALTGPVVRGDVETIAGHLDSLGRGERRRYAGALLAVIDLAVSSGRLSQGKARAIRALANQHLEGNR